MHQDARYTPVEEQLLAQGKPVIRLGEWGWMAEVSSPINPQFAVKLTIPPDSLDDNFGWGWRKFFGLTMDECKAKVGTAEGLIYINGDGVISYAAYGASGKCHTYIDYVPEQAPQHDDVPVQGAWVVCTLLEPPAPPLPTTTSP